jgi:glycine/D-amino acid oxidase-like deaminating enzyme
MTADYAQKSYWLGADPYQPRPSLKGDVDVDVAIVGAGFTGLSTAYHLHAAEPGLRIAVLEADVVGYGASGRNAGFSMTKIGMMHSFTAMRFGKAKAREAHLYADRAVSLLHGLVDDLGLDCDYEHTGFLWVATSTKYSQRLLKEIALVHRLGITGVQLIDHSDLIDRVNSPAYAGPAWWEPNTGILNPAKLSRAWGSVLDAAGVTIYENTPVLSVAASASRQTLGTPQGSVRADKVVLATNAWSHRFAPLARKQVPVWTYIVLTEPLTDTQLDTIGWRGREGIEDFRDLVHYYRLTADNRLLIGGRDVGLGDGKGMDFDASPATWEALRRDVRTMFPGWPCLGDPGHVSRHRIRWISGCHLLGGVRGPRRFHDASQRSDDQRPGSGTTVGPHGCLLRQPTGHPLPGRCSGALPGAADRRRPALGGPAV